MISDEQISALANEMLPTVSVVRVQPGDVIVIQVPEHVSERDGYEYNRRLRGVWPDNRVALLDGGATVHVLREDGE